MPGTTRASVLQDLLHATNLLPNECHLVIDLEYLDPDTVISAVFPARNALQSATAYEVAPEELFALFRRMRSEGLEHLGIYHSHPQGENFPSPSDLERAFYPDAAYFIVSQNAAVFRPIRAFRIREGRAREILLELT